MFMTRTIRLLRTFLLAIILLTLFADAALSQFYLGAIRGETRKIPIAVIDIIDEAGSPALRTLALEVLQSDLKRSEVFDVRDAQKLDLVMTGAAEPTEELRKKGGTVGLAGVVWAKLQRKGKDIVLAGRLYDAPTGMRLSGKDYFGNEESVRRLAHTFADEIVSQFTGEKGIARTHIAFVSDKTKSKELYAMDYDGQNPIRVTADHSICLSPAWSPDGRTLAYVSYRDRNPDLFALDVETGKRWKLSGNEGLNISPAWSPNGKRIALSMSKDGSTEIYTMNRDGSELERLTHGPYDNVAPSWAPNSREIVFTSGKGGTPQLYIMGADGTDMRRITFEGSYNASPDWSPRGERIVFVTQIKGQFKIATINPDGSDFHILTSGPGSDENPHWSPSGRQIVFSSNREGKSNIYVMSADGSNPDRLTPNDANYTSPAWSP